MNYSHLLSPISISGVTLKSRMTHTRSGGGLDGTPWQFERSTRYYVTMAKAGAATVNITTGAWPEKDGSYRNARENLRMDDPTVQAEFRKMLDAIHAENTLCMGMAGRAEPMGYSICSLDNWDALYGKLEGQYSDRYCNQPTAPVELLDEMVEAYIRQAVGLKALGFDGITFHMCYRGGILAHSISPVANQRTDKYGGTTLEERARLTLAIFKGIKAACGQSFLIEIQQSPEEERPGYDVEYWLDYCKLCEGLVDIFQIRGFDMSLTHCTGFCCEKENPPQLKYAEAFKKRGIRALAAPVGGFGDPDTMERFIAEGKTDLIAMARAFIADNELGQKLAEGRGEDVRPCLRCMGKCDFPTCSVNPYYALAKYPDLFPASGPSKKVAVLGGGPAGIQAALAAAERGHQVTLYEKRQELGGQLRFSEDNIYKWQLRDYMYWLRRQIEKSSVAVYTGVEATAELIREKGYDAIICAMGSEAKNIPVTGADSHKVFLIDEAYDREMELGKRIVVIGGGSTGAETALYFAGRGHTVTLLTRKQEVYSDNNHCIYGEKHAYDTEKNLTVIEFATTTEIGDGYVMADLKLNMPKRPLIFNTVSEMNAPESNEIQKIPGYQYPQYPYAQGQMKWPETKADFIAMASNPHGMHLNVPEPVVDETTTQHELRRFECDSIVIAGGREPNRVSAEAFAGTAPEIYVVGDNALSRSIHEATTTAFAAAMAL